MTARLDLSRVWASGNTSSSIIDPGGEKYSLGWIAEIPTFQHMNYLQYRTDTNVKTLAERGFFEWGGDIDYKKGALSWDETDGKVYVSKVASPNKLLTPSDNAREWDVSAVQIGMEVIAGYSSRIQEHVAKTDNTHRVTAHQAGTYTQVEIETKLSSLKNFLNQHEGSIANPHGVTAAQVGAVPISGGAYQGAVDFEADIMELNKGSPHTTGISGVGGMYLTMDEYSLGLNASGKAVWKEGGVEYLLLLKKDFDRLKADAEEDYAVPIPNFWMPLVDDINIYLGSGTCVFTGPAGIQYEDVRGVDTVTKLDEPVFTKDGFVGGPSGTALTISSSVAASENFTISWAATNNTEDLKGFPTDANAVMIQLGEYSQALNTRFEYEGYPIHNFFNHLHGTTVKFAAVMDDVGVKFYMDGVLMGVLDGEDLPIEGDIVLGGSDRAIQNLRIWSIALTPQQISTL